MNIYQKLVEVRKAVPYLQKAAKGHQYNYVSSSQVLAAVRAKMDELGLLLIPRVIGHNVKEDMVVSQDKYGNEKHTTTYFTELDMTFTWINADNPDETIECPMYAQGVDIAGEKGVGKAMTYAEKFFLLKQFNIATDQDDPDRFQEKHGLEPARQPQHEVDDNRPVDGLDGHVVEIPEQEAPTIIKQLWQIKHGSLDKLHDFYNKQLKLGYKPATIEKNLRKEIKLPQSIADVWFEMYANDKKMLNHGPEWYVTKRLEGMSDDEIEAKLAQSIAQKHAAAGA